MNEWMNKWRDFDDWQRGHEDNDNLVRTRPALHEDEDEAETEAENFSAEATLASRS